MTAAATRTTICRDCRAAGPWVAKAGRAIRCHTCRRSFEAKRNRARPHYRGSYRARRKAALSATGGRCSIPGCPSPLDRVEVHHVSAGDPNSTLLVLCHRHHADTFRSPTKKPMQHKGFSKIDR